MPYLVADSALYSEANLQKLAEVKWLTRLPERIAQAKALVESVSAEEMQPAAQGGIAIRSCVPPTVGCASAGWWSGRPRRGAGASRSSEASGERTAGSGESVEGLAAWGVPSREAA